MKDDEQLLKAIEAKHGSLSRKELIVQWGLGLIASGVFAYMVWDNITKLA